MGSYTGTAGNDVIDRSAGGTADTISGLDGNDTITGGGLPDLLLGNQGNDVIVAGSGNDTVYGGFGADLLYGNQGDDVIYGNEDNDVVAAGLGNDLVDGGTGDDNIQGNEGNDTLIGGDGNDVMTGNQDQDLLLGNAGNDQIYGGLGDDTVYGGLGNDSVFGNEGTDVLYGNEGNDLIDGGDGYDYVTFAGNSGDYAFGKNAAGQLIITDHNGANGNEGVDTVVGAEYLGFANTALNPADLLASVSRGHNIYAMGDSNTEGYGLAVGDRWTTKLDALQSGSVDNAGRSGATATVYRGAYSGNNPAYASNVGASQLWDGTSPTLLPDGSNGQAHLMDASTSGAAPVGSQPPIDGFIAGGHQSAGDTAIIMIGRNDIGKDDQGAVYSEAQTLAEIANMVGDVSNGHFLVQSVWLTSSEGTNATGYDAQNRAQVLSLNAQLSSIYGANYVDTNQALMNTASSNGTIDSSLFIDGVHVNATASTVVANTLSAAIDARGW